MTPVKFLIVAAAGIVTALCSIGLVRGDQAKFEDRATARPYLDCTQGIGPGGPGRSAAAWILSDRTAR